MRLVLDTHVVLALIGESDIRLPARSAGAIQAATTLMVSVASLWEIAIKHRQHKLKLSVPLGDLPTQLAAMRMRLLPVTADHSLFELRQLPGTNDPFDRLLLAVAACEDALLLTIDNKLVDHPLAWQPAPA